LFNQVSPEGAPLAALATTVYNTFLLQQLAGLAGIADIELYDVHQAQLDVIADPAAYGITNVTDPCLIPPVTVICTPAQADEHVYWDLVHPSATIHAQIADQIRERVAPVPLPAPLLLVVVAAAALGGVGLRRRA
jgi:outer membrane lipase/esterase